jgi:hypothetical protein
MDRHLPCADNNGGNTVNANRTAIGNWEKVNVIFH